MSTTAASRERRGFLRLAVYAVTSFASRGAFAEDAASSDIAVFDDAIDYGQIIVADPGAPSPRTLWSDEAETAQGFSWAPGTVAFGVPDLDGTCRIVVATAPRIGVGADALWALRVPFTVPLSGVIEVGPVVREHRVAVPPGRYSLLFEARPGGEAHALVLRLTFCDDPHPDWEILRRGTELKTDVVLRREAKAG